MPEEPLEPTGDQLTNFKRVNEQLRRGVKLKSFSEPEYGDWNLGVANNWNRLVDDPSCRLGDPTQGTDIQHLPLAADHRPPHPNSSWRNYFSVALYERCQAYAFDGSASDRGTYNQVRHSVLRGISADKLPAPAKAVWDDGTGRGWT